jgi:hypothetical protein
MPRFRRDDRSLDRIALIDELGHAIDREDSGEVNVRWWTKDGRRFIEVSQVVTWKTVSAENVLDRARELDAKWLAAKGRHISAERLARQLRIGKPRALALVRQIRSEAEQVRHIDIAK